MSTSPRAIVIGAGFGGLAAAVRLRAAGYTVTILEANEQPGGRASVFEVDGFTFDAGPTVITAPYLLDELFSLVGRDARDYYQLVEVDPFYRIDYADGSVFDYVGDEERLVEQIRAFNPRDVEGYQRLARHAERIFDIGYSQLADSPFDTLSDMLRVVPDMVKLENYRTVYGLVSKYIEDPRLRQAFSFQPLLIGGNPMTASSIYLLIHWLERKWGVHYALGGTGSIVAGLWRLLGELGVERHLDCAVDRIEQRDGAVSHVVTADGRRFDADIVVSNADPKVVYERMVPDYRHRVSDGIGSTPSMSLFVIYFGTNRTYPDLKHHTIVLGPRYEGLLSDIFKRRVLADDFSLYLHAPTRTDPNVAPPGHESFYVLSPVPNLRGDVDWDTEHERYKEAILASLEERCLPGLRDSLVTSFAVDPRYFEGRLRSAAGAAFGPEPLLRQSAYFRYHNRSGLRGLYFVGAGTHPGAGVPGVLCSAKALMRLTPELRESERASLPLPATARREAA